MTSATIVAVIYLFAWRSPRDFSFGQALAVVFLALVATASSEYAREMLRKPYVIGRHMYSNGVRVNDVAKLNADGYLSHSPWTSPAGKRSARPGRGDVPRPMPGLPHQDAYRSMKRLLGERNREAIGSLLAVLHEHKPDSPYRPSCPPWWEPKTRSPRWATTWRRSARATLRKRRRPPADGPVVASLGKGKESLPALRLDGDRLGGALRRRGQAPPFLPFL